jgi:hypothetical protein
MGSSIGFFCGNSDNAQLTDFAKSIGLCLVPLRLDQGEVGEPEATGPGCFLSPVPVDELHPYGEPRVLVSDVTDPLMMFMRGYYKAPCLVLGQLAWNNDVPRLASITRPYYQKIARWIRKEWTKPEGWDFYCGPEAMSLLRNGAKTVNFPSEAN